MGDMLFRACSYIYCVAKLLIWYNNEHKSFTITDSSDATGAVHAYYVHSSRPGAIVNAAAAR